MQAPEKVNDAVVRLTARLAGVPQIDPARPFSEIGCDSIALAELALALEDELGVRLSEADLERLDTPAALADAAAKLQGRGSRIPEGIGRLQGLAETVLRPVLTRYYIVEILGDERVPRRGAAIVCANHNSLLDIPFLAIAVPRPIWFMAKVELFRRSFGAWFFHVLGGFPVRRGLPDLKAVDTALATLEHGMLLGMFPEGTRSRDLLLPFLPGAAWMALVRGVPLVPVAIRGAAESMRRGAVIPKRTRVRVAFGEPIEVSREEDAVHRRRRAEELTAELRTVIGSLLE